MTIVFYASSDDPKKLDKTMGNPIASPNVINTDDTISLLNPSFLVVSNAAYFTATHVYCSALGGRYYFINNITLLTGGKMMVSCSIDVLKTYAAQIKLSQCIVTRSAKYEYPTLYIDNQLPVSPNKVEIEYGKFAGEMFTTTATQSYLLTTIGSTSNPNP